MIVKLRRPAMPVMKRERDALVLDRLDRVLVHDRGAHEGQLAQLGVGDLRDRARVGHDARIGHQNAGDVRPVLVHVRVHSRRGQGARDVAAAAAHDLDLAGGQAAVKAGDQDLSVGREGLGDRAVGPVAVDLAVVAEEYAVRRVDEAIAQILGHQTGREILAAGDQLIHARVAAQTGGELFHLSLRVEAQAQLRADLGKALLDRLQDVVAGHAVAQMCVAQIQQIRQLVVAGAALARRGHDHDAARRVRFYYIFDFSELFRSRDRGAAEFRYLQHGLIPPSRRRRPPLRSRAAP